MTPDEVEIRAAQVKLRLLAAEATPGPWQQRWMMQELQVHGSGQDYPESVAEWTYAIATCQPEADEQRAECETGDADWMVMMHPGIAGPLDELLEAAADHVRDGLACCDKGADRCYYYAAPILALARALLGGPIERANGTEEQP